MYDESGRGVQGRKHRRIEEYDKHDDAYESRIQDADIGVIQNERGGGGSGGGESDDDCQQQQQQYDKLLQSDVQSTVILERAV
jgi:hypothetical protein